MTTITMGSLGEIGNYIKLEVRNEGKQGNNYSFPGQSR